MIKLVVSDLDGTLFGRDTIVPLEAPKLVSRLKESGISFTIASGRAEWFVRPIAQALGVEVPWLACNGGTIIQGVNTLRRVQFQARDIQHISKRAEALGITTIYTINGQERVTYLTPWMERDEVKSERRYCAAPFSDEEIRTLTVDKILFYDPDKVGSIAELKDMLGSVSSVSYTGYVNRDAIEVVEKTVNKAAGLDSLLKLLELDASEVLMVADDQNDIEALKMAGIGVAVGNGTPEAKAAADYVCENARFEGIKEAVERFCFV